MTSGDFAAVLLAGGASRRMGRDKALLEIAGQPLWQHQLATLRALQPATLCISGPVNGPYAGAGVPVIADDTPGEGPLAALATVLGKTLAPRVVILAIDLPAMTPDFLRGLLAEGASGVVPGIDGRFEPLAAVYPASAAPIASALLQRGERALQPFLRELLSQGLAIASPVSPTDVALFANLNTPADFARFHPRSDLG